MVSLETKLESILDKVAETVSAPIAYFMGGTDAFQREYYFYRLE